MHPRKPRAGARLYSADFPGGMVRKSVKRDLKLPETCWTSVAIATNAASLPARGKSSQPD